MDTDDETTEIRNNNNKKLTNLPTFKTEKYSSRSNITPISSDEWEDENEIEISRLWDAMNNYLEIHNIDMLDRCKYTDFCNFVSLYTTPRLKYKDS